MNFIAFGLWQTSARWMSSKGKPGRYFMSLAEKRNIRWPLQVPQALAENPWFASLTPREQEAFDSKCKPTLCLVDILQVVAFVHQKNITLPHVRCIRWADIYQSANRVPVSATEAFLAFLFLVCPLIM